MKLKAILFTAAIFGASFFVTSSSDNDNQIMTKSKNKLSTDTNDQSSYSRVVL